MSNIVAGLKMVLGEGLEPPSRPYQSLVGYKPTALTNCANRVFNCFVSSDEHCLTSASGYKFYKLK